MKRTFFNTNSAAAVNKRIPEATTLPPPIVPRNDPVPTGNLCDGCGADVDLMPEEAEVPE